MKTGQDLILAERGRQIDGEGWSPEHDDAHRNDELARAAVCYEQSTSRAMPLDWPWPARLWKPGSRQRNLEKAGALYLAEKERLERRLVEMNRAVEVVAKRLDGLTTEGTEKNRGDS